MCEFRTEGFSVNVFKEVDGFCDGSFWFFSTEDSSVIDDLVFLQTVQFWI